MVLAVDNLVIGAGLGGRTVPVVEDLSLHVAAGETLALVGESGCGKTVTALAVMGLLPPGLAVSGGSIRLAGENLGSLGSSELRRRRGRVMSMIFQEPMTALNPVMTVGRQITEVLLAHRVCPPGEARARAVAMLGEVGIEDPERGFGSYPHEFSGGMRQRVMFVTAVCANPRLIIADEPTTALDATVQAQMLELLRDLQGKTGAAVLLITHNLLAASILADRLAVLYAGRLVETGPAAAVLNAPVHPYTRALMGSQPRLRLGREAGAGDPGPLAAIPGQVPPPGRRPSGCAFSGRCPAAAGACASERPPMVQAGPGHFGACLGTARRPAASGGGTERPGTDWPGGFWTGNGFGPEGAVGKGGPCP
jgi:peptide/nickel transport system ATP-binding protein